MFKKHLLLIQKLMKLKNLLNKFKCWLGLHDVEEYGRIDFSKRENSSYVFDHSKSWYICKNCQRYLTKVK